MLTAADEWHVHQTPEPFAVSGTDRNFYDRSYFGGFAPDGSLLFALAFGIYPHLNVADAHITIVRGDDQVSLHASKTLWSDRADLSVGPISISIVEPLQVLRVVVAEQDGIAADLTFTGRHFPIEEPRFMRRFGPRAFMDYTRLSQGCRVAGWVSIDGQRVALAPGTVGVRDRSWGIRPIGMPDMQPQAPPIIPQFFWLWTPAHFASQTTFWHLNADQSGRPWNTRGVVCNDGAGADGLVHADGAMELSLQPGTRWASGGTLTLTAEGSAASVLVFEPITHLEMRGIGYTHPVWAHGLYHGELEVVREDTKLSDGDPADGHAWHRQVLCRITRTAPNGATDEGIGFLEHLIMGAYDPLGV